MEWSHFKGTFPGKSTHSTPRAEARGMRRVNTERRFLPRFKNRGLAPSNVSMEGAVRPSTFQLFGGDAAYDTVGRDTSWTERSTSGATSTACSAPARRTSSWSNSPAASSREVEGSLRRQGRDGRWGARYFSFLSIGRKFSTSQNSMLFSVFLQKAIF